jgi:hypothetical protein
MYMLSAEARKQALEGLETPEGLHGGLILVPWANQQHLTLSVGYDDATGDHVHYIYVDSLAGPSSFTILKSFTETTKKSNPSNTVSSSRPVAIKTGLQTGGLNCSLWVLAAAEAALHWPGDIVSRAFETELIAWLRASPPPRRKWRDLISSLFQAVLRPRRWSSPGHLLPHFLANFLVSRSWLRRPYGRRTC